MAFCGRGTGVAGEGVVADVDSPRRMGFLRTCGRRPKCHYVPNPQPPQLLTSDVLGGFGDGDGLLY